MRRIIFIVGTIIAIVLIAGGIWFFVGRNSQGNTPLGSNGSLPGVFSQSSGSAAVQQISSPKDPGVAKDFLSGIQNADQITLGGTVIASSYALQIWGDANKGGEALLRRASSTGWALVSLGGGEWNVLALIQEGVPHTIAEQLISGLGGTPSSVASPINIPAGNSIAIGTSRGSVAMNNFYKNADYIAQDQQAVVIQQTATYALVYNVSDSSFALTVFSTPFEIVRQAAENAFLSTLNISEQDACKLSVYEGVSGDMPDQYIGKTLPLSFCAASTFNQ